MVRGAPEITTAAGIVADPASAAGLLATLRKAESAGRGFVTGTLKAQGVRPLPPTIEVADDTVRLSYAAPESLEALRGVLRELELTVQVRRALDVEAPEFVLEGGAEAALVPLLRRWVDLTGR